MKYEKIKKNKFYENSKIVSYCGMSYEMKKKKKKMWKIFSPPKMDKKLYMPVHSTVYILLYAQYDHIQFFIHIKLFPIFSLYFFFHSFFSITSYIFHFYVLVCMCVCECVYVSVCVCMRLREIYLCEIFFFNVSSTDHIKCLQPQYNNNIKSTSNNNKILQIVNILWMRGVI